MLLWPFCAPFHKGPDRGWGGIKDADAVLGNDAPETIWFWPVRSTFIHEAGSAICQRTINHIAMAGYPTNVGSTPINICILEIENIFARHFGTQQIAAGAVQDSLWF